MDTARDTLPNYPRELFAAAALALCIAQVRFPPASRFGDERNLSALKEDLADEYPIATVEQAMNVTLTPQGLVPATAGAPLLRFSTSDAAWSVVLTSELVSLETRGYTDIDEMSARFAKILEYIVRYLAPRVQLRFGLRSINEFRVPHTDTYEQWQGLLRPEVLGIGAANPFGGTVEQTINELRTRRADGALLMRHGFLYGTTVAPLGQRPLPTGSFYLLDLDYYDEAPAAFSPDVVSRMRAYNDIIYRGFRWFVGDGTLYHHLKGA